jgi:Leucine-rich repeat (LRR) protein
MLKGTLPATLSRLRSLTEFKCGVNNLDGKIPSLKEFGLAQELEFGPNKFTGAFPAEMVQLNTLVSFIVSKNALTGTLPSNFNKLQKLERFDASSNQLSSTLPESFASLPKLQELDLSSNYLTGVVHRELVPNVAARPGWYESGFLHALGLPLLRLVQGHQTPTVPCKHIPDTRQSSQPRAV